MGGTTPTLVREIAKGLVSGEAPSPQDDSSKTVAGSITNFGTSQGGPKTDEKRLAELRASIRQAANGWTPPDIEAIFSSSTEEF